MKTISIFAYLVILTLSGCMPVVRSDIDRIRKIMEGCGGGFDTSVKASILATYDIKKAEKQGNANASIEASTETAVAMASFLPEEKREEGYKTYVNCLIKLIDYPEGMAPPPTLPVNTGNQNIQQTIINVNATKNTEPNEPKAADVQLKWKFSDKVACPDVCQAIELVAVDGGLHHTLGKEFVCRVDIEDNKKIFTRIGYNLPRHSKDAKKCVVEAGNRRAARLQFDCLCVTSELLPIVSLK